MLIKLARFALVVDWRGLVSALDIGEFASS